MKTRNTNRRAPAQRCTALAVALALVVAAFAFATMSSDGAPPAAAFGSNHDHSALRTYGGPRPAFSSL